MVGDRFNQTSEYDIIAQFHNLKQTGSVGEYVDKFEEMLHLVRRHNPTLTDNYYISSFIAGLTEYIQHHLQCHKHVALSQAYWLAKRLEQAHPPSKKYNTFFPPKLHKLWNKDNDQKEAPKQTIVELKAAGKCFKCLKPWVPGHDKNCKGKKLYSLVLFQVEQGQEKVTVVQYT